MEIVKQVGDAVVPDEIVVVLETDKVSVNVSSPSGGVITKHFGKLDDTVNVGTPLFEMDSDGSVAPVERAESSVATSIEPRPLSAAASSKI